VQSGDRPGASSGITTGLKITSAFLALGLLVQAWLGSAGFYLIEPDLVTAHEMVANVFFLVALIQVVLAFLGMRQGVLTRDLLVVSTLLLIAVVVQIALGYSGRDSSDAMAWHLPNGVLLMGLCTVSAVLAWRRSDRS
jgi:hypothetical protein